MSDQSIPAYDDIKVGTALFTLVEPHRGHEVAYNRWYERDHFYAGCMIGAGWFAGRRWVATRELKALRYPTETPFLPDVSAGSYLATYWVEASQSAEAIAWGSTQVRWLHEHGRMFEARDHIHTMMYVHRFDVFRDDDPVPASLSLDHPYRGLVVAMVDRDPDADRSAAKAWLTDHLRAAMQDTPVAAALAFTPIPLPKDAPVFQPPNPGEEHRTMLAVFCQDDPRAVWDSFFAGLGEQVAASGFLRVSYCAPFVPTIPGTDTYTDQLW